MKILNTTKFIVNVGDKLQLHIDYIVYLTKIADEGHKNLNLKDEFTVYKIDNNDVHTLDSCGTNWTFPGVVNNKYFSDLYKSKIFRKIL